MGVTHRPYCADCPRSRWLQAAVKLHAAVHSSELLEVGDAFVERLLSHHGRPLHHLLLAVLRITRSGVPSCKSRALASRLATVPLPLLSTLWRVRRGGGEELQPSALSGHLLLPPHQPGRVDGERTASPSRVETLFPVLYGHRRELHSRHERRGADAAGASLRIPALPEDGVRVVAPRES